MIKTKLNLNQSIHYLNVYCDYIDVENDDDYTDEEIIEVANGKFDTEENLIEWYRGYLENMLLDKDFDLRTIEDYDTWKKEELRWLK